MYSYKNLHCVHRLIEVNEKINEVNYRIGILITNITCYSLCLLYKMNEILNC
jgi:hypothetical protein